MHAAAAAVDVALDNDGGDDLALAAGVTGTLEGGAGVDAVRGEEGRPQSLLGGAGGDTLGGRGGADMLRIGDRSA